MIIVSIETDKPLPEWFKLRLFSNVEDAMYWVQKATGNAMMMTPSTSTKMCSTYSCGDLTVKVKTVIPDDVCPPEYLEYYNRVMESD